MFWVRQNLNTNSCASQKDKVGEDRGGAFLSLEIVIKCYCGDQHPAINWCVLRDYSTLSRLWKQMFPGKCTCVCLKTFPFFPYMESREIALHVWFQLWKETFLKDKNVMFWTWAKMKKNNPSVFHLALFQYQFMLVALFLWRVKPRK